MTLAQIDVLAKVDHELHSQEQKPKTASGPDLLMLSALASKSEAAMRNAG